MPLMQAKQPRRRPASEFARRGSRPTGPVPDGAHPRAEPALERPRVALGRVLIVDDEAAIRLVCRINLGAAGFETIEAGDGSQALELARRERPDLILLDVMMPNLDGWHVAAELQADETTRAIPIVFLSARTERVDRRKAHELGALGFVTKPFQIDDAVRTVQHVLERVRRGEAERLRREFGAQLA